MIVYPLALPAAAIASVSVRLVTRAAGSRSPFSGLQQVHVWPAGWWEAEVEYMPMPDRETAEDVVGWLAALNGRQGSFLMGDPLYAVPRGTWAGASPTVNGAGQTGLTLAVAGLAAGATARRGDRFQLGAGATARLHMVTADATASGAGQVTLSIWPRLRASPANGAGLTLAAPLGRWMLADDVSEYSVTRAATYGVSISCVEDLRPT